MNLSRFINLLTQGLLALLLLISPVSSYSGSPAQGHPKIHTEWVSIQRKTNSSIKNLIEKRIPASDALHYTIHSPASGKLNPDLKPKQVFSTVRAYPQKTIPSGAEDELIV